MTDIILSDAVDDLDTVALIELLFFAYRDFVSDPDAMLRELGFGRAHHRALHFVGRAPGMTVAQLLDILQITKQSFGRVLRDLVEKGYVFQKEGDLDRRQRLLFLSPQGEALLQNLMAPQIRRIERALAESGSGSREVYRQVLSNLINPENRKAVSEWIEQAKRRGGD